METPCCIVDDHKVVMDVSSLNECILVQRDQLVHMWCKSQRQYISDYFRKGMNETDRPKITNGVCTISLGQQMMFAEFNRGRSVVLSKWKAFAA
jgi:hypothetical protein